MNKCEFAGCGNAAEVAVATLAKPSPIPPDHPDYGPPQTTLSVCREHESFARLRAAALEAEVLRGEADGL